MAALRGCRRRRPGTFRGFKVTAAKCGFSPSHMKASQTIHVGGSLCCCFGAGFSWRHQSPQAFIPRNDRTNRCVQLGFRKMNANSTAATPNTGSLADGLGRVGIGYNIAIAVALLVLMSAIVVTSFVCLRIHSAGRRERVLQQDPTGVEGDVVGLDRAALDSYPKIVYTEKQTLLPQDTCCSICLTEYKDGEILKLLPECGHILHAECIDAWLSRHASCPMCRSSPLPTPQATPGSTPLSELIALSRNALSVSYIIDHHV